MRNIVRAFRFDGEGTPKDRLLTALLILLCAYLLSLAAVYLSFGRLIAVAWGFAIVGMSALEVARLLARDSVTTRYLPFKGVVQFIILFLPSLAATVGAIEWIGGREFTSERGYAAIAFSAALFTVFHVISGRSDLARASQEGERFAPAFILVSLCGSLLIPIAAHERGIQMMWWMIGTVAVNDAAAYFIGRSFGRIKMAPALSPNKSVEGSVAGLCAGVLFGVCLWGVLVRIPATTFSLSVLTLSVIISAQAADLSKSYVKRLCGVKDTGAIFPGHGGVLDRFDGAIGAAPILYLWIFYFGSCCR